MSAFGSPRTGVEARISESTAGAILQPQPPPWLNWVKRSFSGAFMFLLLSARSWLDSTSAQAAEDVGAIRQVEVAELRPHHPARRAEARAAQHLVRAEPRLRIILV